MKAIALFSGGLDSQLAVKLILNQDIDVHGIHFTSAFTAESNISGEPTDVENAADRLGIPLAVQDITDDLIQLIKDPAHGLGSGMNPCVDCRITQLRRAKKLMEETGARFLITGEVVGQRPMSQRKGAMNVIERESDVEGLLLRPLCARQLDPTIPEQKGWVDRDELKNFTGRSRKPQMALAQELGVTDYPDPAGGCRLTEPNHANRVEDLHEHNELNRDNVRLLEVGRHFRLSNDAKLVIGRNHEENLRIEELARDSDYVLIARHYPGPTTLGRGDFTDQQLCFAARLTARYGKGKEQNQVVVDVCRARNADIEVPPAADEDLSKYRL